MKIIILEILLILVLALAVFLLIRQLILKYALKNIAKRLEFIVSNETNLNIDLGINQKSLKQIADSLSRDIEKLKQLKHSYRYKDLQLRESIADVSHDLRTPLTVIASFVHLIKKRGELDSYSLQALEVIESRTLAMNSLIEELFQFSLYESGQFALELSDVCINDLLEKCITQFYHLITEKNIEPKISLCEQKITAKLDAKAFERIISNIMNNAIKYSEGDLEITLTQKGKMVFSNTTTAVDTVALSKLFNRFYTVENGNSSSGLGLSIAQILTERMGGNINAQLENNKLSISIVFP